MGGLVGSGDRWSVALAVAAGDVGDVVCQWSTHGHDVVAGGGIAGRLSGVLRLLADGRAWLAVARRSYVRGGIVANIKRRVTCDISDR